VDGNRITDIRTAATSAVAVDALAVRRPLKVGVLGSSSLARNTLLALASVRELSSVRVFSPTPASRERFAEEFKASLGIDVVATAQPETAVHVVLCAARSRDESPVLLGRWLAPGTVVVSVGSTLPEQREVDVDTLARAALIVADMVEEVIHDTGDAIAATQAGVDVAAKTVSLHAVKSGQHAGRGAQADIVLYKSVGSALQDVVTAERLLRQARLTRRCAPMAERIVTITR
jgi:alanine dehydrogenase